MVGDQHLPGAPQLSVLITTRDGAQVVGSVLASLAAQQWVGRWEVVVADNGSRDQTLELVEGFRDLLPALRVVDAAAVPGRSAALNAAAAAARGDLLVFVDQDDEVGPGYLAAMAYALDGAELVGGRLEHRRLNPGWTLAHRGEPQADALPRLPGARFAHSWGCAIGVHRSWHERVGGADPAAGAADDQDYCYRVQQAGGRLAFAGDAVLHYRHRTRLPEVYRQSRGYARSTGVLRDRIGSDAGERPRPGAELRAWAGLVRRLPVVPRRRALGVFAWVLGERVGSLQARRDARRSPAAPRADVMVLGLGSGR